MRVRSKPVQIYLSEDEAAQLEAIAERRGTSKSAVIRRWVARSSAKKKTKEVTTQDDPRQMRIEGCGDSPAMRVLAKMIDEKMMREGE